MATYYLCFRTDRSSGKVLPEPKLMRRDDPDKFDLTLLTDTQSAALWRDNASVTFAVHGFNVPYESGIGSLGRLEGELKARGHDGLLVGVLWPGDWYVTVVNYLWVYHPAVETGDKLAAYVLKAMGRVPTLRFATHSMGARVALQAMRGIVAGGRRIAAACLTAAAVDDNCIWTEQYRSALDGCDSLSVLASRKDLVVALAYPLGDAVSDAMGDDDGARKALGRHGPRPLFSTEDPFNRDLLRFNHGQVANHADFGHDDYFPSGDLKKNNPRHKWSIEYIAQSLVSAPSARAPLPETWPKTYPP